jgi:hypothetical protein
MMALDLMTCLGKKRLLRRVLAERHQAQAQTDPGTTLTGIRYADGLDPSEAYLTHSQYSKKRKENEK